MEGAWRRPPNSLADYGHTERERGAECWGKSPLVTLGLFSKVTRCKSGTLRSRYLNNGYVPGLIQHSGRLSGRLRGQARSRIWIVALTVDCGRLSGRLRGQARSRIWIVALTVDCGRLSGRFREQARSHSWIVDLQSDSGRMSGPAPPML